MLCAGLVLGTAAGAQASIFTWNFSGTIGTPTDANPPGDPAFGDGVFSGAGTNQLIWGNPTTTGPGNPLNSLTVNGTSGSVAVAPGGNSVQLALLDWHNTSVYGSGGVWETVLSFSYTLGSVVDTSDVTVTVDNTFDDSLDPALNNASGLFSDVISGLSFGTPGQPLDVGDGLTITSFYLELLNAGQCGTNNFGTVGSTFAGGIWTNCEGNISTLAVYANVNYPPPAIPLPAAGLLLLSGLGVLGVAARGRRAPEATAKRRTKSALIAEFRNRDTDRVKVGAAEAG